MEGSGEVLAESSWRAHLASTIGHNSNCSSPSAYVKTSNKQKEIRRVGNKQTHTYSLTHSFTQLKSMNKSINYARCCVWRKILACGILRMTPEGGAEMLLHPAGHFHDPLANQRWIKSEEVRPKQLMIGISVFIVIIIIIVVVLVLLLVSSWGCCYSERVLF